jgi:cation transport protein ChaC
MDQDPTQTALPLRVFAYGSLIWKPGFPVARAWKARLDGFHRRFCLRSRHYRGTKHAPGLVLGLDTGGACEGVCLEIDPAQARIALAYVLERELLGDVYHPGVVDLIPTESGQHSVPQRALSFLVNHDAPDYTGKMSLVEVAAVLERAHGQAGANIDYFHSTVAKLAEWSITDAHLTDIGKRLRAFGD